MKNSVFFYIDSKALVLYMRVRLAIKLLSFVASADFVNEAHLTLYLRARFG